jgi:hypothetical protein
MLDCRVAPLATPGALRSRGSQGSPASDDLTRGAPAPHRLELLPVLVYGSKARRSQADLGVGDSSDEPLPNLQEAALLQFLEVAAELPLNSQTGRCQQLVCSTDPKSGGHACDDQELGSPVKFLKGSKPGATLVEPMFDRDRAIATIGSSYCACPVAAASSRMPA